MSDLVVRLEDPRDREASLEVERQAFNSELEAEIARGVREDEGSFAFVAEVDGEVVGHVQCSRAWVGSDPVEALGPIGVLPSRQGAGVGSALVRAAVDEARRRGETAVILLGSPAFYPRFGFEPGSRYGLKNPFAGVQVDGFVVKEEDFMIAPLDERAKTLRGRVRWHAAFGSPVEAQPGDF